MRKRTRIMTGVSVLLIAGMLAAGCGENEKKTAATQEDTTDLYGYNVWDYVSLGQYKELEVTAIAEDEADASEIRDNLTADLWSMVIDNTTVTGYPQELYDSLADAYEYQVEEEAEQWELESEEYLDFFYGCTMDEYIEQGIQSELILMAIQAAEGIELSDEEYTTMLEKYLEDIGCETAEEAEETYGEEEIKDYLLSEKVYDFLIENAIIKEVGYDEYYMTDTEMLLTETGSEEL